MKLTTAELRTLATPPILAANDGSFTPPQDAGQLVVGMAPGPTHVPAQRAPIGPSSAIFGCKVDPDATATALRRVEREFSGVIAKLREQKIVGPPKGCPVLEAGPDAALTGLAPDDFLAYDVDTWDLRDIDADEIPRLPFLPEPLREHETAFAEQFAKDVKGTIKAYLKLVGDSNIFSVDLAKRLYEPWGSDKKAHTPAQKALRATANLALHQTAVAIARAAFLQRLDELAELPESDPRRRVVITAGGSGSGKGRVMPVLAVGNKELSPGAVFDAAGEGEARECAALLEECKRRNLRADFVYVHKPIRAAAVRVVDRVKSSGRMVDVLPMVRGHLKGAEVFRAFAATPEMTAPLEKGRKARCYGYDVGEDVFDADPLGLKFPYYSRLDRDGVMHVPQAELTEAQAVLVTLLELAEARRKKAISERALEGALLGIAVVWPDYFDSLGLGIFRRLKAAA